LSPVESFFVNFSFLSIYRAPSNSVTSHARATQWRPRRLLVYETETVR